MKRRLQLMPEVLPAPNKTATSAVRERTMARLRVLAAVGTGIAAACGGSTATPGGGSSSGGSSGGGPDGGLPDANKPDSDPGYGVVDPLPRPTCFDSAEPTVSVGIVTAEDAGVDASGGSDSGTSGRYARLVLTFKQKDVAVGGITFTGNDLPGLVEKKTDVAGSVELVLVSNGPGSHLFNATIIIQTSCPSGPTSIQVRLSEPTAGDISATLSYF